MYYLMTELQQKYWEISPSKIEGYHHNYYIETLNKDELSVDFNPTREMVRISLSIASEGKKEYITTLKNGIVLQEREGSTRRPVELSSKISRFTEYFYHLNNPSILQAIGGNFNLPKVPKEPYSPPPKLYRKFLHQSISPWQAFKKYIHKKRLIEKKKRSFLERFLKRLPNEIIDICLGSLLFAIGSQGYLSLTELACLSGFYGIFCGALDWLWRQRSPFLPKVFLFIGISIFTFYTHVQYRFWGIYV